MSITVGQALPGELLETLADMAADPGSYPYLCGLAAAATQAAACAADVTPRTLLDELFKLAPTDDEWRQTSANLQERPA